MIFFVSIYGIEVIKNIELVVFVCFFFVTVENASRRK